LAGRLAKCGAEVIIARVEENTGEEAIEVGRREMRQLMRDAAVEESERIETRVLLADELLPAIMETVVESDLVLISANKQESVQRLMGLTSRPTIAVIKRTPPLRLWPEAL
jgi:hypothetical protein